MNNKPWKIWFEIYRNGEHFGSGVMPNEYKFKANATRFAKKKLINKGNLSFKYYISKTNPWRTNNA